MWLPKKERKLLAIYAERAKNSGIACEVSSEEIIRLLDLRDELELFRLKTKLEFKGMLTFSTCERPRRVKYEDGKPAGTEEYGEPKIFLTEEGYNIGLKYCTILGTFELWSRDNIWFWVVLGVVISSIGILTTILVSLIKD